MSIKNGIETDGIEMSASSMFAVQRQTYPKVKKGILRDKIQKIKNKEVLANIFLKIEKYNPDIRKSATGNQTGILMLFNNLSYETYIHLEKYLKKYERKRQEMCDLQTSDDFRFSADNTCSDPDKIRFSEHQDYINSKLRYSNKEKMLIRRCEYEAIQASN